MNFAGRAFAVVASGILLLAAGAARAESPQPKFEGFPPKNTKPIVAPTESPKAPAPAVVVAADVRVESSELGFDTGVAPAPGRTVDWQGSPHRVIEVAAIDGGTIFSGGSRHVIGQKGSRLMVALKFIDPDSTIGAQGTAVASRGTN